MPSVYTPLTDDEQDVLQRMIEGQDAYVEVVGWGFHPAPKITAGDKRVQVRFPMEFHKPQGFAVPVNYFDLRLRLRDGRIVFSDRKSCRYSNQPLFIEAGLQLDLIWDIALDQISDDFKDQFLPRLKGNTVMSIEAGKVTRHDGSTNES